MADENIKILSDAIFEPWVIESIILERKYVSFLIKWKYIGLEQFYWPIILKFSWGRNEETQLMQTEQYVLKHEIHIIFKLKAI